MDNTADLSRHCEAEGKPGSFSESHDALIGGLVEQEGVPPKYDSSTTHNDVSQPPSFCMC